MGKKNNEEGSMTILEHLVELRKRVFRSLLFLLVVFCGCYIFSKPLLLILSQPLEKALQKPLAQENSLEPPEKKDKAEFDFHCSCTEKKKELFFPEGKPGRMASNFFKTPSSLSDSSAPTAEGLKNSAPDFKNLDCHCQKITSSELKNPSKPPFVFLSLTEIFSSEIKVAFWMAIFFSVPYLLIEIWGFLSPALYKKEKKMVGVLLVGTVLCFVGGALFSYYVVFPTGFQFFLGLSGKDLALPAISLANYLDFALVMLFIFGLVFELPVLCLILASLGVLDAPFMLKHSRAAILIIFVLSGIITPPDPLSMLFMALPLVVLYFLSYVLVGLYRGFKRVEG